MSHSNGHSSRCAVAHQRMANFGGTFVNGRWQAAIRVNGKNKYLGRYDTSDEARAAYVRAAIQYGRPLSSELRDWFAAYEGTELPLSSQQDVTKCHSKTAQETARKNRSTDGPGVTVKRHSKMVVITISGVTVVVDCETMGIAIQ